MTTLRTTSMVCEWNAALPDPEPPPAGPWKLVGGPSVACIDKTHVLVVYVWTQAAERGQLSLTWVTKTDGIRSAKLSVGSGRPLLVLNVRRVVGNGTWAATIDGKTSHAMPSSYLTPELAQEAAERHARYLLSVALEVLA